VNAVDVTGADAVMTLASIERAEMAAAVDTLRWHLASPNVEVRELAGAWVGMGDVLISGGDVAAAIRDFNEVVALLTRPAAERLALLQARETVNNIDEGTTK
jgi:hypothetical protein